MINPNMKLSSHFYARWDTFIYLLFTSNPVERMEIALLRSRDTHLKQSVRCWFCAENPSKALSLRYYDEALFSSIPGKNLLKNQRSDLQLSFSSRKPLFLYPIGYSRLCRSKIQWRIKSISRIENKMRLSLCDMIVKRARNVKQIGNNYKLNRTVEFEHTCRQLKCQFLAKF